VSVTRTRRGADRVPGAARRHRMDQTRARRLRTHTRGLRVSARGKGPVPERLHPRRQLRDPESTVYGRPRSEARRPEEVFSLVTDQRRCRFQPRLGLDDRPSIEKSHLPPWTTADQIRFPRTFEMSPRMQTFGCNFDSF
jgi:hypothetical protein